MPASNVLQEYLIRLGFTVDERQGKKADDRLLKIDLNAKAIAKAVLAAGVAVQAFVAIYAHQMEKLYYSSKKADSSVSSLQSLEYGFKQVGGQSGQMINAVEGLNRALRSNPGLTALLNNLGVKVTGRDKADVMIDLVKALKSLPSYHAQQYASLFGIDPDTLFLMTEGLDKLEKAQALRKQMAAEAGIDLDKAAASGMEYSNMLDRLVERLGILKDLVGLKLLPYFQDWAASTDRLLADLTRIIGQSNSLGQFWERMVGWFTTGNPNGAVTLTKESRQRLDQMGVEEPKAGTWLGQVLQLSAEKRQLMESKPRYVNPNDPNSEVRAVGDSRAYRQAPPDTTRSPQDQRTAQGQGDSTPGALFARLEALYKLPAGVLDRVWAKESLRGDPRYMKSSAGAQGHFQFMPGTARQYGLDDPNDLAKSATAAARYLADLLKKYGGDLSKAAAAYNWGPGNVDRYGLGRAPAETRDYVKSVAGAEVTISQTNTYNITDSGNSTAQRVAMSQEQSNANLVRDLKQRVY